MLLTFEAVCYVANSFAHFLALSIAPLLFSIPDDLIVGEFSLVPVAARNGREVPKWEKCKRAGQFYQPSRRRNDADTERYCAVANDRSS